MDGDAAGELVCAWPVIGSNVRKSKNVMNPKAFIVLSI